MYLFISGTTTNPQEKRDQMLMIGDTVKTKALNGETFIGTVIGLDRFGFADVSFNNVSETRILITQLEKGE